MMKSCMIASVRTRAGLGTPPEKFYTNDSENTNRRLRHKTGGKELGETAFAKAIKELIEDDQETEFILALYEGSEQYEFRGLFKHLIVSREDWFAMSEAQRKKKVASVYALAIEELYEMKDTPCQGRMYAVRRSSFAMCNEDQEELSLSLPASAVEGLDFHIAQQIWKKASRLLAKKDAIFPAPSKDTSVMSFSVISETSDTPNFVQLASNGKITCTCKNYRPKKVCSHAIAVAEKENRLNDFVSWYRKQKVPNNLTAVASLNVNVKASGRKKSAPRRHRQARLDVQIVDPLALTSAWVTSTATSITDKAINSQNGVHCGTSSKSSAPYLLPVAPAPAPATFAPPVVHLHTGFTRPSCAQLPVMGASQTASINPHMAVPPGFPLPPKPPLPHTPNRYFLAKLKGNIARCNGCEALFDKSSQANIDAVAVIGRNERDWFPFVFADSSKCWRMGRSQNHYYHPKVSCLRSRNPNFKTSDLASLLERVEGGLLLSNEMARDLWEPIGDDLFH